MLISELELVARDLPALRSFWAETLGLPVRDDGDSIIVQTGASQLRFRVQHDAPHGVYHVAFNIPTNRFAEARAWLEARVPLLTDSRGLDEFDFVGWNAHAVYFRDADANILELIARHGLANATEHPFGGQDILAISEIGLAVDDVAATVAELARSLDAPVYDGAGSDAFSAVGDEHGLLIVVARGRVWYPDTGVPAVALPLRAAVETGAGRRLEVSSSAFRVSRSAITMVESGAGTYGLVSALSDNPKLETRNSKLETRNSELETRH